MNNALFRQHDLRDVLEAQKGALANEIDRLSEAQVLNTSPADLSKYFVEKCTISPIRIDEENIQIDYKDTQVDVRHRFDYAVFDKSRPAMVSGTQIRFYVPFTGDEQLLRCQPSSFRLDGGINASSLNNEIVFSYSLTTSELSDVSSMFQSDLRRLKEYLGWIESDINQFNDSIKDTVDYLISTRRDKLLIDRGTVASLGFRLRRRDGVPKTYATQEARRRVTPQLPSPSTEIYEPEPALSMEHYEHILSIISNMVTVIEQSPQAFREMKEEHLRQHFLVQLNGHYEGSATAETFNYEGKTDILIKDRGKNVFVAECKFWNGPSTMTRSINQILGYLSWRDTKAAIILFNRNRDLTRVLTQIPEIVEKHPNHKANLEYDIETGYRYIMGHRDDPNRDITLTVLVFDTPS